MIYLDHAAAAPLLQEARVAMLAAAQRGWANPASAHAAGRAARALLEQAREQVAEALGAPSADIVLTAGGTEACNLAVLGLANAHAGPIVSLCCEHPAVAATLAHLQRARGGSVALLAVPGGRPPTPTELRALLTNSGAKLLVTQWVNHETGTVFPVPEYLAVCADLGIESFVDATQALGKLPLRQHLAAALPQTLSAMATALAVGSAKIGGPTGAGAVWVRRGTELSPSRFGGAQERGRRAGTPDVATMAGFGAACAQLPPEPNNAARRALRDRLEAGLVELGAVVNGGEGPRVAEVSNVSLEGRRSDELVAALDLEGVCVSAGAACSSGLAEPSPVLRGMYPEQAWRAQSCLRFSLGQGTTEHDIEQTLLALRRILARRP